VYVRQGPAGVSVLCLIGGLITVVSSILGFINVLSAITSPVTYLVNVYTLLFGFMIMFLEAEPERMKKSPILSKCLFLCSWGRVRLLEQFKFLTAMWSRGLFYLFVGSFGVIQWTILSAIVGIWMMVCGILLLVMQCFCRDRNAPAQPHATPDQV